MVDAVPEPAESADAFAALEQAFAVEAADDVVQGDEANVDDAAPEPTAANGSAAPVALVVPLDVEDRRGPGGVCDHRALPTWPSGCVRSVRA